MDDLKKNFINKCDELLGSSNLKVLDRDGWDSVREFSVDWRKKFVGKPLAVCFPSSSIEVKKIVDIAIESRLSLVPQGGNTGLSGGATPNKNHEQVVVCLKRMNKIISTDYENRTITLQAGCSLSQLQTEAKKLGLFFPLDFTSREDATVGGFLSTNAGGLSVLKYGSARSMCLGVEVVLPNGDIWNGLGGLRKDNAGYDIKDLFIGSEGTLGFITSAVVSLVSNPTQKYTSLLISKDLNSTLNFFCDVQLKSNNQLTAFEIMTDGSIELLMNYFPELIPNNFKKYKNSIFILVEISEFTSKNQIDDFVQSTNFHDYFQECINKGLIIDGILSGNKKTTDRFWKIRESVTYASAKDGPQVKNDISLPISSIPSFVEILTKKLKQKFPGVRIINFGHLGDGNLHFNIAPPIFSITKLSSEERKIAHEEYIKENERIIRRCVHDEVVEFNGSISAEHGIGQLRKDEYARIKSSTELAIMKKIKNTFDPNNIMNPGKFL